MIGAFPQHRRSFRFSETPRTPFRQYLKGLALAIACGWLGTAATGQMTIPLDDPAGPQRPPPSFSAPTPPLSNPQEPAPDIRDIHGPIEIRSPWRPWLIGGGIAVAVAAVGWLLALLIRRLLRKPEVPPLSPYDRALEELHATRPLMKDGRDKDFSIAVSDTVRYFLERQFAMPAPESTTEEFLSSLRRHELIKGLLAEDFSSFLSLCDLAKFARKRHGLQGMEKLYLLGEKLIEETYLKHYMQERVRAKGAPAVSPQSTYLVGLADK